MTDKALTKAEKMLLERVQRDLVSFTFEPDQRSGKARLVRSTTSGAQQPKYHALAVAGYLSENVHGDIGHKGPPSTTVEFHLTALGREALGIHAPVKAPVNRWTAPTDEQLAVEGLE